MACQGTVLIFLPGRVVSLLAAIKLLNPWKWDKYGGGFIFLLSNLLLELGETCELFI